MNATDENFDRFRFFLLFASLMDCLYLQYQSLVRTISQVIRRFCENAQISDLIDIVSDSLSDHPILRFVVISTALSCVIPIVVFIVFGIFSLVITFAGFLFIEGTLLALGCLCMFISLVAMVLAMSVLAVFLGFFYILGLKLADLLNKFEGDSHVLRNILPSLSNRFVSESSVVAVHNHQD